MYRKNETNTHKKTDNRKQTTYASITQRWRNASNVLMPFKPHQRNWKTQQPPVILNLRLRETQPRKSSFSKRISSSLKEACKQSLFLQYIWPYLQFNFRLTTLVTYISWDNRVLSSDRPSKTASHQTFLNLCLYMFTLSSELEQSEIV